MLLNIGTCSFPVSLNAGTLADQKSRLFGYRRCIEERRAILILFSSVVVLLMERDLERLLGVHQV